MDEVSWSEVATSWHCHWQDSCENRISLRVDFHLEASTIISIFYHNDGDRPPKLLRSILVTDGYRNHLDLKYSKSKQTRSYTEWPKKSHICTFWKFRITSMSQKVNLILKFKCEKRLSLGRCPLSYHLMPRHLHYGCNLILWAWHRSL